MSWVPVVLTRRMVLITTGVTALTSCASDAKNGSSSGSPAQTAQTDAARDRALAAEADLLARYDAALALPSVAADSALTMKLASIREEHLSHAAAIRDGYAASPAPTASPSPTIPGPDSQSTIAALAKAEQDAASARTADILAAEGTTAMLLASVAASESGHIALLLGAAG
ncbi:MAG: hypothetical protein ACJ786_25005 [Catenulispora sp.]